MDMVLAELNEIIRQREVGLRPFVRSQLSSARRGFHARRTAVIRMALPTTERLVWRCGDHTAKPKSAPGDRFLIMTKLCCCLWHVGALRSRRQQSPDCDQILASREGLN